jgi:TolA-binding protein
VAQNAYYHLGESYLNLDKKQEALNAFKNASEMNFDLAIQEDASLNYAKLSYEMEIRTRVYLLYYKHF